MTDLNKAENNLSTDLNRSLIFATGQRRRKKNILLVKSDVLISAGEAAKVLRSVRKQSTATPQKKF